MPPIDFRPDILLDAATPIPEHGLGAFAAVALGGVQLALPAGTAVRKATGSAFVIAMAFVAISSPFLSSMGAWGCFSPIHLLVPVTLYILWRSARAAVRGDVAGHRRGRLKLYVLALVVRGLFTFRPGRIMFETVFGPPVEAGEAR